MPADRFSCAYQEEKMAATRLITLHVNKSKGASASMHERIEYSQNPEKTEDGELITAYACQPETAAEEFLLARRQYQEIRELRMHIINYSKTRDIYTAYRKAGYSRNFFEAHREEITLHKAAKDAFDQLGFKKIPRAAELNEEFNRLAKEKNVEYVQYRTARERMRDLANAR